MRLQTPMPAHAINVPETPVTRPDVTSTIERLLNFISRFSQALRMVRKGRKRKLSAETRSRSVYRGLSKYRAIHGAVMKKNK